MKKSLLLIIGLVLVLAVALAACETDINNGQIDVDPDIIEQLPCTVEVTGLEEVTGTVKVTLPDAKAEAAALTTVKDAYYVADGATTYAVDIKIEKDGKEVTVGKPITVAIELKAPELPLDQYVVFHIHDGKAEQVAVRVEGGKLMVTVENFSIFLVVPAHVHAYGEWQTYAEPDCANGGVKMRECACGAKETQDFGEALGHVDANADELCDRCGTSLHVHRYGEWRTVAPATCTEAGQQERVCACGAKETQGIDALGHDKEHHAAVAETCTEDGNIEYFSCNRCGKLFLEAECETEITLDSTVVAAVGHVDDNEDGKCDACGLTLGEAPCTVQVTDAEGATLTAEVQPLTEADKAAALQLIGETYYVDDDAIVYAVDISVKAALDQAVSVSITLKNPAAALDQYDVFHVHGGKVDKLEATVSEDSLIVSVSSFSPFLIAPKHKHIASPVIEQTPATCLKDGEGYTQCIKCHQQLSTEVLPALGHVDANGDEKCDRCGTNMHVHAYGEWMYANGSVPGCTTGAQQMRVCACGDVETRTVPALGHIDQNADGYCDRCGTLYEGHAHLFGEWQKVTDATCTAAGSEKRVCDCGAEETRATEALGHIDENKDELCDRCGANLHVHNYGKWAIVTEAGCTTTGVMERQCTCGEKETKDIEALGHLDANKDEICDRCGADLNAIYTAMVGKVYVFDRAEGEGITQAAYDEAYAEATLSFFEGKHAEYHTYKSVRGTATTAYEVVLCGNYTIVDGVITLTTVNRYVDGEQFNGILPTITFAYNEAADEASIVVNDGMGHDGTCYFAYDSEATATEYTPPALADNWDATVIESAFKLCGADNDYVLPKLDYVDSMTASDPVDGVITITCLMASKASGYNTASAYINALKSAFYAYKLNGTVDGYLTANSECFFTAKAEYVGQIPAVIITVRQFAPVYPAGAITQYLTENEITDEIISFMNQWAVAYDFWAGVSTQLVLTLRTDADAAEVVATLRGRLQTEKGYEEIADIDGTVYLYSTNKQIVFKVETDGVSAVAVFFYGDDVLPMYDYPADQIEAWLTGTTDDFVEVSSKLTAKYEVYYENDANYGSSIMRLVGILPNEVDGSAIVDAFADDFAAAGYKYGSYFMWLNEAEYTPFVFAWISPNQQIAVQFTWLSAEYLESVGRGDADPYYNVTIVNLTTVTGTKSFLTSLLVQHQDGYDVYDKGSEYTFRGLLALRYTTSTYYTFNIPGEFTESLDTYFDFDTSAVDMNTVGTYTIGVSYKANPDINCTFDVKVFGMTEIAATYQGLMRDGRVYYTPWVKTKTEQSFKSEYTITRYFSDGTNLTSDTVSGTECTFSSKDLPAGENMYFGAIDNTVGAQTIVIANTYHGVTCTCEVEVGVYVGNNSVNNNDWDIMADNAAFAIYALGGSYGDGTWVSVEVITNPREGNRFAMNLYVDAVSFYIVRLNPAYDVFGETVYDLNSECVWNKTTEISAGDIPANFAFVNGL